MFDLRKQRKYIVICLDIIIAMMAWIGAFVLRFNLSSISPLFINTLFLTLPFVLIIQAGSNYLCQIQRASWRFVSLSDLNAIIKSAFFGLLLIILLDFFLGDIISLPRSLPFIYAVLLILGMSAPRFIYRQLKEHSQKSNHKQRVLIIGAGTAGESLARDLLRSKLQKFVPIAFVDDSPRKIGQVIHGLKVFGPLIETSGLVTKLNVDLLIIAMPALSARQRRRVVEICEATNLPFRTVPTLEDLASGRVSLNNLRHVAVEDLLGREPVSLDKVNISNSLKDKIVMVTGGAGSIGSELCRQIIQFKPKKLIILDSSEYNLYAIDMAFKKENLQNFTPILMDICDRDGLRKVFSCYQPDVVFHAAAYKHVPLLENQIRCAIRNNVIGTCILAEEAANAAVGKFIMVSTDKAVNPTNVMGATKRIAEIFCQNFNQHMSTKFITVRFGNVLGSAGSVVPLFKKQLEKGGPITVTHPDMTRYFMTIEEAAQLILQAEALGSGGEIFVLDMGEPIKIQYLAEQIIFLANSNDKESIEIVYTGLRPGEKLYEELFYESENKNKTSHEKIYLAQASTGNFISLQEKLQSLVNACSENNEAELHEMLKDLVPEYSSAESSYTIKN